MQLLLLTLQLDLVEHWLSQEVGLLLSEALWDVSVSSRGLEARRLVSECRVWLREALEVELVRYRPLLLLPKAWEDLLGTGSLANLGVFLGDLGLEVSVGSFQGLPLGLQLHALGYAGYS